MHSSIKLPGNGEFYVEYLYYLLKRFLPRRITATTLDANKTSHTRGLLWSDVEGVGFCSLFGFGVAVGVGDCVGLGSSAAMIVNVAFASPSSNTALRLCLPTASVSRYSALRVSLTLPEVAS